MQTQAPIPFEEFMSRALHHPDLGYYAKGIRSVGQRGDFTTAPMLSAGPAKAIASWAAAAMRETGCRDLIEIGPGEGRLAAGVLAALPWTMRWKTRLHLVETSSPLRDSQQKLLGKKAHWHEHPSAALAACKGAAVIFSNELVDAFPVRRFRLCGACWHEMAVTLAPDGRVSHSLLPPSPLPDSSVFSMPASSFPDGQVVEVHDSYRQWQSSWLADWTRGRRLTIDYGNTVERLYHRRPHGTVRAYLMQHRLEGDEIYQNIGRQDITADVNFSDLMKWSESAMESQHLESMGKFLSTHAGGRAVDPMFGETGGAGDAFLVLDELRIADGRK